jgi:precorrin-2 C20-methyltransferase (EC 2.1.1.130)/cobalt-factor II C20-methyltransferase (EC 2.1.1.151)
MTLNRGKFYGVGVGPGDSRFLTLRAVEVLQTVDIIAIPKSKLERESVAWEIARKHCHHNVELLELEMPMTSDQAILQKAWQDGAQAILTELQKGRSVAFVTLGDASLYSTYAYLLDNLRPTLSEELIETVPGITAMSAAAARINIPLAVGDEPLLVLPSSESIENYLHFPNLVLLKVSRQLPQLLEVLLDSEKLSILLTRLGQTGEEIRRQPKPKDIAPEEKIDYLSLMLVKNKPGGRK